VESEVRLILLLKVVQSKEVRSPVAVEEAYGILNV
jgi:hypothetical protein